jgi:four helix bundle protein
MGGKSFEELEVWKLSRVLTKEMYSLSNDGIFARDFGLKDQIRRASVSIMSNIAEGFERGGNKEFIQFLYIAKASCGEVRSQLYVAHDQNYINDSKHQSLYELAKNLSVKLSNFIKALRGSKYKGDKYN